MMQGSTALAVVQARDEGGVALDEWQGSVCALRLQSFPDGHLPLHCT